jgi:hypothetical protein
VLRVGRSPRVRVVDVEAYLEQQADAARDHALQTPAPLRSTHRPIRTNRAAPPDTGMSGAHEATRSEKSADARPRSQRREPAPES